MFFSFFFSTGRTLDTEELCLMTSRSPRYYVSAAYWDRDSLLWSFPAILMADSAYAREMLQYVFTRQIRNIGVHSRFIDGTVLEPGFELDELCAPVIALERYVHTTGDRTILSEHAVKDGLARILRILDSKKHRAIDLYETFLQPTDDMRVYPYLTYNNALVWKALGALADFLQNPALLERADRVRRAIQTWCVSDGAYVWSTDLAGHHDIYDEPPGSLQLLPFYGFCSQDDPIWQKTLSNIRNADYPYSFAGMPIAEIGCAHAAHPWVLSICNSLLCGHQEEALLHLSRTGLDNGIACESVHEETGECTTGEAFATCAGFLSFALWQSAIDPSKERNHHPHALPEASNAP
jgi:meiotically up-regulated gene 157 (Mug157) protein